MEGDLEVTDIVIQGNILKGMFNVIFENPRPVGLLFGAKPQKYNKITRYSRKYVINRVCLEIKVKSSMAFGLSRSRLYVKFSRREQNDDAIYSINVISNNLRINKKFFCDDTEFRFIFENNQVIYKFDITVEVETITALFKASHSGSLPSFVTFHDDLTELHGLDGSIFIHSSVLAASSPALRRMLEEKSQATGNQNLEIPQTSKATLQHLKNYLYLNVLPENSIEHLLPLASCFLMEDLKNKCMEKIISSLNAQNAVEISKFALAHNIMELYFAFLECIQRESVKVKDIRECNNTC